MNALHHGFFKTVFSHAACGCHLAALGQKILSDNWPLLGVGTSPTAFRR